jgi:hypothetical protein
LLLPSLFVLSLSAPVPLSRGSNSPAHAAPKGLKLPEVAFGTARAIDAALL